MLAFLKLYLQMKRIILKEHLLYLFFQAEDGIRDYKVTGVQTCALPIFLDDREQVVLVALNALERVALRVGQGTLDAERHHLDVSADRVERCAKLVTHDPEEFRLGPVRRRYRLVGPSPLLLGTTLGRDVPEEQDAGEDPAASIPNGGCVARDVDGGPLIPNEADDDVVDRFPVMQRARERPLVRGELAAVRM